MGVPIFNASSRLLNVNSGTLPEVSDGMMDWFQQINFNRITKTVVNGLLKETTTQVSALGLKQPMKPQMVMMKPEGQRTWKWFTLHAQPGLFLKADDQIVFIDFEHGNVTYRVMEKFDFSLYGYNEYHIVEDYTT